MDPSDVRPEPQPGDLGQAGPNWQVLVEFPLPPEGSEEELAGQIAAATELALQNLQLPQSQLDLLKNSVSQAARNAYGPSQARALSGAGDGILQRSEPVQLRILTPSAARLSSPVEVSATFRAWGYFLIERNVGAGLQAYPVIDIFLYPEGSL